MSSFGRTSPLINSTSFFYFHIFNVSLAILTFFVIFKEAPSPYNENLPQRGVEELDFFGLRRSQL